MNERKILVEKDVSELADADLSELVTELQSMLTTQQALKKLCKNFTTKLI